MPTTTPAEIKAINGSEALDAQIQPFASAAICIMISIAECLADKEITDSCADEACTWLGAHLMAGSPIGQETLTVKKESFENWSEERVVSSFSGEGVKSTFYGQTANTLTGGCLAELDMRPAGFFSVGC